MKITRRQLERLISEVMGDDVKESAAHPHITAIRMVEALRPVIQSGNIENSLEALDALWDHLHNTSPVPTSNVPESPSEHEASWEELDDVEPLRLSAPKEDPWKLKARLGIGQGTGPYDKYGNLKRRK